MTENSITEHVTPIDSMLIVSKIIYDYGFLRSIIQKHEVTFNEELSEKEKKKRPLVAFKNPSLIDTRMSETKLYPSAKMNKPVDAKDILQFLQENRNYLKQEEGEDIGFFEDGDNTEAVSLEKLIDQIENFDADIVEFDDEFSGDKNFKDQSLRTQELVYSIVVNRTERRVVVVFRGSITLKDFLVDFRFSFKRPELMDGITDRKDVKLHRGFSDYLLEDTRSEKESKMDKIMNVLKDVYSKKEYSDFDLFVTGHSLGGSLAQIAAFILAGSKSTEYIPKPVQAITFASPVAGNDEFRGAYQDLEKENKLRHIRVANENDVVTCSPFITIFLGGRFVQTGVNLNLLPKKKMTIGYCETKSVLSQLNIFKNVKAHSIPLYREHLFAEDENGKFLNEETLGMTVEDLYEKYAVDQTA